MNNKTCKWSESNNKLCWTAFHDFLWKKTKEISNFLENKLRKADLLTKGNNRFPFFLYNKNDINTIENVMILHSMKYMYQCKFDVTKPNIQHYRASLLHLCSVCYSISLQKPRSKTIKKIPKMPKLLIKYLWYVGELTASK